MTQQSQPPKVEEDYDRDAVPQAADFCFKGGCRSKGPQAFNGETRRPLLSCVPAGSFSSGLSAGPLKQHRVIRANLRLWGFFQMVRPRLGQDSVGLQWVASGLAAKLPTSGFTTATPNIIKREWVDSEMLCFI